MKARSQEQVTDHADPLVDELVERQFRWRVRHRYADEAAGRVAAREMVLDRLPRSRLIRTPVGFVWLGPDGEQTPVYDVRAGHVADVPSLRALAIELSAAPAPVERGPGRAEPRGVRRRRAVPADGDQHAAGRDSAAAG